MNRGINLQLAINLSATIVSFAINIGVNFLLTPFIVSNLGVVAYGFVSLATNVISYTQLLTIALNSMAGRFITISYVRGEVHTANKYFSSVFFSNLILSILITLGMVECILWLEHIFEIPDNLLFDVKLLFIFLSLNTVIGLLANVYTVATFVKNRLDLSSIRNIISNIIRGTGLFFIFFIFAPHIWYIGFIGTLVTIYLFYANYKFTRKLVPDLYISVNLFDREKVIELIKTGIWNSVNSLGNIFGQGLDLIIVNVFIGATAMGIFSISRQLPILITGVSAMVSSVFAPAFTLLFAKSAMRSLVQEINKSIRIQGCIVIIPLVFLIVYGADFFALWMPSQDSALLQLLSLICCLELIFSLPFDTLWNIFQVTNKIKYSTLFIVLKNFLSFIIVLTVMHFVEREDAKLLVLVCTRTFLGIICALTFSPLYGANCLNCTYKTFYFSMLKFIIGFSIAFIATFMLRIVCPVTSWTLLIVSLSLCSMICTLVSSLVIITKDDRKYIKNKIFK